MKIEEIKIGEITPYSKNAKTHTKKQIKLVADSIKRFGFIQPVVLDKNNEIVIGHCRYEASKLLKMETVPCVSVKDLTDDEIKALRLADNKLNESAWNMELVIPELLELDPTLLGITGFDPDLLLNPESKDDDIPEDVPSRAKLGDIYQLGEHRVICGDSTQPDAILSLLDGKTADMTFCDPLYNVAYEGGAGKRRKKIENDKMSTEAFQTFLEKALEPIIKNTKGGIYVCMSPKEIGTLKDAFEVVGGHWSSTVIWVKNNFTLSGNDYQNTYEPILYGWGSKNKPYFVDRRDASNVWEDISSVKVEYDGHFTTITFQGFKVKLPGKIEKGSVIKKKQRIDIMRHDKPIKSPLHPTSKPVSLVVEAISNSSRAGDIVLDTFLGSGTTIIGCEKSGRICYGVELDEHFCDVCIQRWVNFTGITKIKKNGEEITWSETKNNGQN